MRMTRKKAHRQTVWILHPRASRQQVSVLLVPAASVGAGEAVAVVLVQQVLLQPHNLP